MSFLGKGSSKAPAAPDPNVTAEAQMRANIAAAIAQARLNRVNQSTPWGSINYTQGEPDENGVPTWSSNITLDPASQALLDQSRQMATQRSGMAQNFLNNMPSAATQNINFGNLPPVMASFMPGGQWNGNPTAPQGGGMQANTVTPPSPNGSALAYALRKGA